MDLQLEIPQPQFATNILMDSDLVPLPIESTEFAEEKQLSNANIIKQESYAPPAPLKSEAEIETETAANNEPLPLPINDNSEEQSTNTNTHRIPKPPPKIIQSPPRPPSSYYAPPPPHSPQRFMAAHLRPPPPLTPMTSIASDGSVIGFVHRHEPTSYPPAIHNSDNDVYGMAPPPPPGSGVRPQLAGRTHMRNRNAPSYAIEYNCDLCRLAFNTKGDLLAHKSSVHGIGRDAYDDRIQQSIGGGSGQGRKPRYFCGICNRSFTGKQHFEYHMRTHSGEKPFKCQTCGKTFRAKHSLKNHTRIHTGERPYQCKVCGKWFRQLGVMKNHLRNMHSKNI